MTRDDATMSLLEHLEELRSRIIVIAIAVLVAAIAGFFLADPIITLLRAPLEDSGAELIQTNVGEAFSVRLQLALMCGVAFAMPVILYEIWAFVTPGLTRPERRLVWPLLIAAVILFAAGVALGYLLIPLAVGFLLDFSLQGVQPLLGLADYIGFVTTFLLAFGIALQFPVILYLLARVGILSYAFLVEPPALRGPADRAVRDRHHPGRPRDQLVHARDRHVRALRDHAAADPDDGPIALAGARLRPAPDRCAHRCARRRRAIPSAPRGARRRRPAFAMPPAAASSRRSPSRPPMRTLTRVHDPDYVAALADAEARGGGWLDPDTYLVPGSMEAARLAAGATIHAARAAVAGEAEVAFAAVRPPGHHARRDRGSGFCLLNHVAIAVAALRADGAARRVAIVDWDVHHGNGTAGDLRRRSRPHLRLDPPVPVLSGHRRRGRRRRAASRTTVRSPPARGTRPSSRPGGTSCSRRSRRSARRRSSFRRDTTRTRPTRSRSSRSPRRDSRRSRGSRRDRRPGSGCRGVALTLEGGYDLDALRALGRRDGSRPPRRPGSSVTAAILGARSSMEGIVASTTPTETTPDPRASSDGDPAALRSDAELDHLLVISGLSGAGKSQASKLFEDLGYSVVDNLPPALLEDFLALRREDRDRYRRSALVLDIRAGDPAPAIERAAAALDGDRPVFEVIFLEASDETSSTASARRGTAIRSRHGAGWRRRSPRSAGAWRGPASWPITSSTPRASRSASSRTGSGRSCPHTATRNELRVDIVTFGYKYGIPLEADLVFDVRFLTNPYWDPELKPLSGKETKVRDFVLQQPTANRFLELVTELLTLTAPAYRAEGKEQLRIALGCTGGFHRSIALAEELARAPR